MRSPPGDRPDTANFGMTQQEMMQALNNTSGHAQHAAQLQDINQQIQSIKAQIHNQGQQIKQIQSSELVPQTSKPRRSTNDQQRALKSNKVLQESMKKK